MDWDWNHDCFLAHGQVYWTEFGLVDPGQLMEELPDLAGLPWCPYLNEEGQIDVALEGKAGVYGIFDREQNLVYVGISRDIALALQQHLVRVPDRCYWYKVWTIDRLDRDFLLTIQKAWQGDRSFDRERWEKPIDCREWMTAEEKARLEGAQDEKEINRLLKDVARRVEEEIKQTLAERGVKFAIRFDPKRKEEGLLDLKVW